MLAGGEPYHGEALRAAKRSKLGTGVKSCTSGEYCDGDVSRVKRCDFDVFLSEENNLYTKNEIRNRKLRGEYVPSDQADRRQIKAAAKEYCRRGLLPGYELRSPFVKVAEKITIIPPPNKVPSHFDVEVGGVVLPVRRIVFFLYKGDLFIVKIASGSTHSNAVTKLIMQANDYSDARRKIFKFASDGIYHMPGKSNTATFGGDKTGSGFAPDFGIISLYPIQGGGIPLLQGVFIAEVEVFHRDESALIVRLSKYAEIPQNKYLCGIKIYKDNGHMVHRAAIGVVWKRKRNGAKYEAIKIMNFGCQSASTSDIDKWIGIESTTLGRLPSRNHSARTPSKWRHHPAVTYAGAPEVTTDTNGEVALSITDADLVSGVVDSAGQAVAPVHNLNFDIDFGKILSFSDGVLG